jgi:AcrR family transcriptional regulator
LNVNTVNIKVILNVVAPRKKTKAPYHHGNLEHAMIAAAVQIIRNEGLPALTLRGVGAQLGVSRSALYRHFADKEALLARVSLEGFRSFRKALQDSYAGDGRAAESCLPNMAAAYVHWALANPSHYAVMFGAPMKNIDGYPELMEAAGASFRELLDAIVARQMSGDLQKEPAIRIANSIWSLVHGVASLSIDRLLEGPQQSNPAEILTPSELAACACRAMLCGFGTAEKPSRTTPSL